MDEQTDKYFLGGRTDRQRDRRTDRVQKSLYRYSATHKSAAWVRDRGMGTESPISFKRVLL